MSYIETAPSDPVSGRSSGQARNAQRYGVLVVALGGLGFWSWFLPPALVPTSLLRWILVNPTSAVALVLLGTSVIFSHREAPGGARMAAMVAAAIGLAKIIDLVAGGLPVDTVLLSDRFRTVGNLPNRMAPNTAVAVLMSAAALALIHARAERLKAFAQLLAAWVILATSFVLLGHVAGFTYFSRIGNYLPMAPAVAVALLLTSYAILSLTRDVGLMAILRSSGPAGTMFRITLPMVVCIPAIAGALRIWSERRGYFGEEAGVALQVASNVVVTSALLIAGAVALHRSDLKRRDGERVLRDSERFNRLVASANPDCIALLDEDEKVLFANDALVRATGLVDSRRIIGRKHGAGLDPAAQLERAAAMRDAREFGVGRLVLRYAPQKGGEPRWYDTIVTRLPDDEHSPFRFLAISRDITEKREIEEHVRWKAAHDDLTGLPNRAQFQMHLERQIRMAGQEGFAVLLLDIDNFKMVNDTLGHDAGDSLLKTVSERVSRAMRRGDMVARLAGDEFAVIACSVRTEAGAIAVADRIFESLREPWIHQGRLGECRVSIGASLAPRHGDTLETLLKHADIALYDAKSRGKGRVAVFRPSMRAALEKRSRQIELARHALEQDLIVPYYQPKVALATGRITGFEALLRWRHPSQGVQAPQTIEAAFEDLEIAGEITQRMLDHVLLDMSRWLDRGVDFGHVAINVTAADLRQDDFAGHVIQRMAAHGLPHECLQVEITETVFMGRGAEYVERALRRLHDAGIRVALDDFGTGYASLSHLKQFPVDIVKIDRSFLQDFARDSQNQAIINTVISLGRSLDIAIVAEGVETRDQERHLLARGCTYGQGFHYGKAVPAVRVPRLLQSANRHLRTAA